jgi:hypothetical protein
VHEGPVPCSSNRRHRIEEPVRTTSIREGRLLDPFDGNKRYDSLESVEPMAVQARLLHCAYKDEDGGC